MGKHSHKKSPQNSRIEGGFAGFYLAESIYEDTTRPF